MTEPGSIERYYERNTRRFLRYGGGQAAGTIHRQLWGPGVRTAAEAAGFLHRLLIDALALPVPPAAVLDLGCGVGGTCLDIAAAFPATRVVGVSISGTQIELARRAAAARQLTERVRFFRDDIQTFRSAEPVDTVLAVEAFVHCPEPEKFFATAAAHLPAGGRLLIVDDFLATSGSPAAERLAATFRRGWRVPGFTSVESCLAAAGAAGFVPAGERDLTGLIRLDRWRDRCIAFIAPVADRLGLAARPGFGNLIGGNALRAGLGRGAIRYRWLEFRFGSPAGGPQAA